MCKNTGLSVDSEGKKKATHPITSFETVTLRVMAMRFTHEYEILPDGDNCSLSLYEISYDSRGDKRILLASCLHPAQVFFDLINECKLAKWDGFSGDNPRGVRDGYMFTLRAKVNDGQTIYADGSNNFPARYYDFKNSLDKMLREEDKG